MKPVFEKLWQQISSGLKRLPVSFLKRHKVWLENQKLANQAFPDRAGNPDLYYTSFGTESLYLAGEKDNQFALRAIRFSRENFPADPSVIDYFNLVRLERLIQSNRKPGDREALEKLCTEMDKKLYRGSGWALRYSGKEPGTYATFLALGVHEFSGLGLAEPEKIAKMLVSRKKPDGSFAESKTGPGGEVTPSSAAVLSLKMLGCITDDHAADFSSFLQGCLSKEGGISSFNGRPPDLLSTFAGLTAVHMLGLIDELSLSKIMRFIKNCQAYNGGFTGGTLDKTPDSEYTYYGLGAAGLIAASIQK